VALAATSALWMGLSGGSLVAWHLVALCLGRTWLDPMPLAVLILPTAILWTVLGSLEPVASILPLAVALVVSTLVATSDFLPGRLAGAVVVLGVVALVGSVMRPLGAAWMEALATFGVVAALEIGFSAWTFRRSLRRPADALGNYSG
jgi:hypothetical protein